MAVFVAVAVAVEGAVGVRVGVRVTVAVGAEVRLAVGVAVGVPGELNSYAPIEQLVAPVTGPDVAALVEVVHWRR